MRRRRAGFTLLEVLLAMAMMTMLAGSLYAGLHIAFSARERMQAAGGPARAGQVAVDLIRRDLESALPPRGILAGVFYGADAVGADGSDADSLLFHAGVTSLTGEAVACDVSRIEFALGEDEDGTPALIRYRTTNLLAAETPEPYSEVLLRNVASLNFYYFDGSDWLESWDSTAHDDSLPPAVEVRLELEPERDDTDDDTGHTFMTIVRLPCASPPEGDRIIRGSAL